MPCVHGRDSGKTWGNCKCRAIECHCKDRLDMLRQRVLKDAVDYHTQLARPNDPYSIGYVLVRERWCAAGQCSYYIDK